MVDYAELENTGARYFKDATTVTDIMGKISQGTRMINETMQEVVDSNEDIAITVEQNTVGIVNVAQNASALADNLTQIVGGLEQVQTVMGELTHQAEIFRICEEGAHQVKTPPAQEKESTRRKDRKFPKKRSPKTLKK